MAPAGAERRYLVMTISTYRYNIAKAQIARGNLPPGSPRLLREQEIIDVYEAENTAPTEDDGEEEEETQVEITEKESQDPIAGLF